jgi:hypothetical protein
MIRKLVTIGVSAIILVGSIAASASAKGGGGATATHAGHAGGAASTPGHGPPVGFVYDRTAPPSTRCQPGVCFNP